MKLTRHAPGRYSAIDALGREWIILQNTLLGRASWLAFEAENSGKVIDPCETLREVKETIETVAKIDAARRS